MDCALSLDGFTSVFKLEASNNEDLTHLQRQFLIGKGSMKKLLLVLLVLFSSVAQAAYPMKPKLIVVFVVDQMRADYLTRYQDQLGSKGIRRLMRDGAYFPQAEHDNFQNMTGPGHAAVLSGAYAYRSGIVLNEWFDQESRQLLYCVADPENGISPKNFNTTTLGDELKLVSPKSLIISLALKDRAAVLMGGRGADFVLWFNKKEAQWVTSRFYSKASAVPEWVSEINSDLKANTKKTAELDGANGHRRTADLAVRAIQKNKLGADGVTDLLAVSFSSFDYTGHRVGPLSPDMIPMLQSADQAVADILEAAAKSAGGSQNLLVALTSDHGIPPMNTDMHTIRMDPELIESTKVRAKAEAVMTEKYGKPGDHPWIGHVGELGVFLDWTTLEKRGINRSEAEKLLQMELRKHLPSAAVAQILTSTEIEAGRVPPELQGRSILRTYYPGRSPSVLLLPQPYHFERNEAITQHMTNYAYDRVVPLLFWGQGVSKGIFPGGHIVDLAPTLAFILGITPPAASEGMVLKSALKI